MRSLCLVPLIAVAACDPELSGSKLQDAGPARTDAGEVTLLTPDAGAANKADAGQQTPIYAVRAIPGLKTIIFWERTGGDMPTRYEFQPDGDQLTIRAPDPLVEGKADIIGVGGKEFYDVYYSDQNGVFDIDGHYLTISGVYGDTLPAGGGLNLAEIELTFEAGKGSAFGKYIGSHVALGDNAVPASVTNCIDGDLQTHTTMGNTVGTTERLRITLGFPMTVQVN